MEAFYQDGQVSIYHADVLDWALDYKKQIDAGKALPFMAVISDPPYGLGNPPPIEELLQYWLDDKDYETGAGFMSKNWDQVVHPKYWRALYNITLPGGYLFCFSGTRTADLLGIACRLGGWESFDRIAHFAWVHAQGMAKGVNISKALDLDMRRQFVQVAVNQGLEIPGNNLWDWTKGEHAPSDTWWENFKKVLTDEQWQSIEREVISEGQSNAIDMYNWLGGKNNKYMFDITAPATPLAQAFDGYNTQLAPKHEPILLFRKPRDGRTFAQCAREFGSGGLDIDSCRVGTNDNLARKNKGTDVLSWGGTYGAGDNEAQKRQDAGLPQIGRWPPNCHFTHSAPTGLCPTCNGAGEIIVSSVPMSLCPNCLANEGGSWTVGAPKVCPDCGTETTEFMMHDNKLPCADCFGEGVVGGCRRVGSKRVSTSTGVRGASTRIYGGGKGFTSATGEVVGYADPDGLETVADWECVEGCAVRALDEMAGESKPRPVKPENIGKSGDGQRKGLFGMGSTVQSGYQDTSSSVSRFFPCHDWALEISERMAGETPFAYVPKASRGERDAGLGELPEQRSPKVGMNRLRCATCGGWQHTGDTVAANRPNSTCSCETPDFEPQTGRVQGIRNTHPTVKPLSLCKWLAMLCLPPAQFEPRIAIPFCGSGSEVIGAILAGGWFEIHAIERELEYCEIAAARIAWWSKWYKWTGKDDPGEIRKLGKKAEAKEDWQDSKRQTSLFELLE